MSSTDELAKKLLAAQGSIRVRLTKSDTGDMSNLTDDERAKLISDSVDTESELTQT